MPSVVWAETVIEWLGVVSHATGYRMAAIFLVSLGTERARLIDEMEDEIGVLHLFQGGPEGPEKIPGEIPYKTDGVGYNDIPLPGETQTPAGGIKSCEHLAFRQGAAAGQGVQKSRFSGVGVADDRDYRKAGPRPA